MHEKVTEAMEACLKNVGTARTCAITLQGLEYADNLSDAIKKHAEKVEKHYTEVLGKLKASSTSDKELEKVFKKIEDLSQGTQKLQAGLPAEYLTNQNDIHGFDGSTYQRVTPDPSPLSSFEFQPIDICCRSHHKHHQMPESITTNSHYQRFT
jgi:hypothetical protein